MENIIHLYVKCFSYFTGPCNSWESLDITHDLMVKEYQNWGHVYTIQLDIKITYLPSTLVTNLPPDWLSVFQILERDNKAGIDRKPAIFVNYNLKKLYFYYTVSGVKELTVDIQLNKLYQIVIQQFKEGKKYWFEIIIDGVSKVKIENTQPKIFSNVKFYAGNPWYEPFSSEFGSISNIIISKS